MLRDIHSTLKCTNIKEYTFFSAAHGTVSKTGHILGQKQVSGYTGQLTTSFILSDHNGMKLQINNNRKYKNTGIYGN